MTPPEAPSTAPRTWRKPPFIANPLLRYGLIVVAVVYLVWAFGSLPFNWARISEGLPRAARIFSGGFPPSLERYELLLTGFKESFQIAILATLLGVLLSIPFAVMAARNIAPMPIYVIGHMRAPSPEIWLGASHTQGQKISISRTAQTTNIKVASRTA